MLRINVFPKARGAGLACLALVVLLAWLLGTPGCTYMRTRSPGDRISYEERVGQQFALEASTYFRWMDEPEVLDFVKDIGHRISAHVVGTPYEYRFFVIRDPTMNAFAVPGGYICFFAGLISLTRRRRWQTGR